MKDPQRLLIGDGTALERELLRSVLDEPVPGALHARMLAALPLHGAALDPTFDLGTSDSSGSSGPSGGSGLDSSALENASSLGKWGLAKVGSGVGLKSLLVSLGIGSALTVGFIATRPSAPNAPSTSLVTAVPAPVNPITQQDSEEKRSADAMQKHAEPSPAVPEGALTTSEPAKVVSLPSSREAAVRIRRGNTAQAMSATRSATEPATPNVTPSQDLTPKAHASATLSAELKLLDAARGAIQRGDAPSSLQALDSYARQFPNGELAHEATVLRGLAQHINQ